MESTEPESDAAPIHAILDRRLAALGLYVHIPFCSSICNYCNFNRGLYDEALKTRYVAALRQEIAARRPVWPRRRHDLLRRRHAVAARAGRDRLDHPVRPRRGSISPRTPRSRSKPIPETVDRGKLERFRAAGVNRISFGVQSFQDDELKRLGRIHSADRARAAVREARAAGFDNVSLDLMMWLPGQSVDDVARRTSTRSIEAAPDHASLYLLELYPNAPLKEEMARGGWSLAPDDDAAEMYLRAMERLEARGPGAVRDLERRAPGQGVAPQPEVLDRRRVAGVRVRRALDARTASAGRTSSATDDYVDRVTDGGDLVTERRVLSSSDRLEEALFTGLRLTGGLDIEAAGRPLRHRRVGPIRRGAAARFSTRDGSSARGRGCG